jgi:hypothetical protein
VVWAEVALDGDQTNGKKTLIFAGIRARFPAVSVAVIVSQ